MRFVGLLLVACAAVVAADLDKRQSCASINAQCGGQSYTGATCCESGSSCVKVSDWYSQCRASSNQQQQPSPSPMPAAQPQQSSPTFTAVNGGASGNGKTTRYWDCCKPSCAWTSNVSGASGAVKTCSNKGTKLSDQNIKNVCSGSGTNGPDDGFSYMCTDNQPWAINDSLSYGFAAASISGVAQNRMCCACYELTFTSGPVKGKKMVLQATNTGGDLGSNHFDIQMPGGGLGIFDGCSKQFGIDAGQWGQRYGGLTSASECSKLPSSLQKGCDWRFGWFQNADNPEMTFREVVCPSEITAISGCKRN